MLHIITRKVDLKKGVMQYFEVTLKYFELITKFEKVFGSFISIIL